MNKYIFHGSCEVPVWTSINAETEERAFQIAKSRVTDEICSEGSYLEGWSTITASEYRVKDIKLQSTFNHEDDKVKIENALSKLTDEEKRLLGLK